MKGRGILAVLLASIFMVSMVGCSNSKGTSEQSNTNGAVSLKVWGAEEDSELLSEIVENFKNEYKDKADFDIVIEPVSEASCKEQIFSDVNNAADVFTFADDQMSVLSASGVLEPAIDADNIKENNIEGAVDAVSINDKLYAYPMTADNGYFLYYNKQFLSSEDAKSLDKILSVAAQNNKKFSMDWNGWYLYSFFGNTGLKMGLNDDGVTNYCNWNTNEGEVSGLEVAKYINNMAISSSFINTDDDGLVSGMKDGSIIAGVSGVWLESRVKEALGDDYGATKLPTYNCGGKEVQMASFSGYKLIGVNSYSKNKDWANKLAEWITNEDNQLLRFEERGQGPSNINVANSDEVSRSLAIQALLSQSQFASLQRVGVNYWDAIVNFQKAVSTGSLSDNELQKLVDNMTNGITASIIKQ
ncbi:MAG: extracellular solute-binding protein [Clostridiales bacterium]|nr:extracellular solute-binding protein [Clostridiales bacterium]MDY2728771.1 extracellular solute-binding protein [Clostridium sp.]NLK23752.1 extracellular solute-binding protein [Clostridiales bacterium]